MSQAEFDRVRNDLETMRVAAGMELPFGWEDVGLSVALVPAGAALAGWAAISPRGYAVLWGAIPIVGVLLGAVWLRIHFRRSTGRSSARRREYTFGLITGLLVALCARGYIAWERAVGVPPQVVGGAAVFFTGVLCVVLALTGPGRRSLWAAAVALLPYGLIIPYCTPRQVGVAGGVAVAVAGGVAAVIQAWQLRRCERRHEPATH